MRNVQNVPKSEMNNSKEKRLQVKLSIELKATYDPTRKGGGGGEGG